MDKTETPPDIETDMTAFRAALTELSIQHGIGIAGILVLFLMERDDYDRTYRNDAEGRLEFK